jgi:hypothetical protein
MAGTNGVLMHEFVGNIVLAATENIFYQPLFTLFSGVCWVRVQDKM